MNMFFHFTAAFYLVGFFISAGIAFGMKKQDESWGETLGLAIFLGLFSWINIGIVIGDLYAIYLNKKNESTEK